jgi:hypothetical protein
MRRIVHYELGEPARVLRLEEGAAPLLAPDQVRVRLSCAPVHPGDLLGVMGSPAFGTPPTIGSAGRVPGFEGTGVVSEVRCRAPHQQGPDGARRKGYQTCPKRSRGGDTRLGLARVPSFRDRSQRLEGPRAGRRRGRPNPCRNR